jgi:hypothetical protein
MRDGPLLWALAAVGLVLRLAVASRDLDVVDRLFIPDDTYYTISIARSLAGGLGPTADGSTLTSGFQPLLAFLLVPVFWITSHADTALRATLLLTSTADAFSALLLGLVARAAAGPTAAWVTTAMWSLSPLALGNALGGLETSLALALQIALVLAWSRARASGRHRDELLAGVLAGACLLARVDAAFLVALLGALELFERRFRPLVRAGSAALIVVAPWWLYAALRFGSPVPESGAAVLELVELHRAADLTLPKQLGWAAGSVIGAPFVDATSLRNALFPDATASVLTWVLLVLTGCLACSVLLPRDRQSRPLWAFAVHALAVLAFYSFVLPALWFFKRYLAPCHALCALLFGIAAAQALRRARSIAWPAAIAVSVLLGVAGTSSLLESWSTPATTPDAGLHGAKGYREAVRDVLAQVPRGAVIGALQSGALAYYGTGTHRIVNLDGVVDARAASAVKAHRLADYARVRHVTHLADWRFNVAAFTTRSANATAQPKLDLVAVARNQGDDRFHLYRISW